MTARKFTDKLYAGVGAFIMALGAAAGNFVLFLFGLLMALTSGLENKEKAKNISSLSRLGAIKIFMPSDEGRVIEALAISKEPLSLTQISRAAGLDKVKVYRVLKRLANRGIVERVEAGSSKLYTLSWEARKALAAL